MSTINRSPNYIMVSVLSGNHARLYIDDLVRALQASGYTMSRESEKVVIGPVTVRCDTEQPESSANNPLDNPASLEAAYERGYTNGVAQGEKDAYDKGYAAALDFMSRERNAMLSRITAARNEGREQGQRDAQERIRGVINSLLLSNT